MFMANERNSMKPMVSVVIPSVGRFQFLVQCLRSLTVRDVSMEVIVVAMEYADDQVDELRKMGATVHVCEKRIFVSEARNLGARIATGAHLLFLDDDNTVGQNAVEKLSRALSDWPEAAVVGPTMYYGDDSGAIWCAGVYRSRWIMRTHFQTTIPSPPPDRICSEDFPNCFMVRREEFEAVGGFDSENFPIHFEEADLAKRLCRYTGGQAFNIPTAAVWHHIEHDFSRRLHIKNEVSAYYVARNGWIYRKKYANTAQKLAYGFVGQWLWAGVTVLSILTASRTPIRTALIKGYLRGLYDSWHYKLDRLK